MCNSALDQGRGEQAIIDVAPHRARVRLLKLDARGPTAVLTEIDMTRGLHRGLDLDAAVLPPRSGGTAGFNLSDAMRVTWTP